MYYKIVTKTKLPLLHWVDSVGLSGYSYTSELINVRI